MAIDKSLYAAPTGLDLEDSTDEGGVDVALALPADAPMVIELDDGGAEITFGDKPDVSMKDLPFDTNLAEHLDMGTLSTLAGDLTGEVETDIQSRREWADAFVQGLEVLGFKYEMRTDPWEDACGVYSTILAEAVIRFQAETMSETFPAAGPVKTRILGKETEEKVEAAQRVRDDMNYELTEVMTEYRPEHERLLYSLGLAGSAFKKVYADPALGRQAAIYLPAEDVIVPYGASHIESAERVTHVMRKTKNELETLQANGFYVDVDLGEPVVFHTDIEKKKAEEGGYSLTQDNRYALYEIHANLVIEGLEDDSPDGLAVPYVVTIDRGTDTVLAVYRNWDPDDAKQKKRQHFVHYVYVPGFGFYGRGLIHIIGG